MALILPPRPGSNQRCICAAERKQVLPGHVRGVFAKLSPIPPRRSFHLHGVDTTTATRLESALHLCCRTEIGPTWARQGSVRQTLADMTTQLVPIPWR